MKDNARWFDALGKCSNCGKIATGILRGLYPNENYGPHCRRCAERRIGQVKKLNDAETTAMVAALQPQGK